MGFHGIYHSLVGGLVSTNPSEKDEDSSIVMIIPFPIFMEKQTSHVPNHQPAELLMRFGGFH